jgi:alpha-glucosidase
MRLLHPTVAPWLVRDAGGCTIALLCGGVDRPRVSLRADPDNEETFIPMRRTGAAGGLQRYEARLPWDSGNTTTHYAFKVIHGRRQTWLAADGAHPHTPPRELFFKVCRDHEPPAWVRDQIVYQIFPDRFCQGDPALAVETEEYVYGSGRSRVVRKQWGDPIDPGAAATAFYGGDLVGIRARLDYLQDELGVTTLYLNPVFTSGSNHKYDTEDFFNVDPHLGGNQALADLAAELRGRGMRLILDAVVNHTGANHPWFNRYGRHDTSGAYQSESSRWRSWYSFTGAQEYQGWNGHPSLPVLDFATPEVRAMVYEDPGAVLRHWLRPPYSIDGWRLDVIHMLGEGPGAWNNAHHVRAFRRAVREENREAYLLGEHFAEATRWLQGDQEDGAMNYYGFALPVRAWLAGQDGEYQPVELSTHDFEAWLTAARARVPFANQLAQLNLLGSHDTARFLTLTGPDLARMKLAVTLQFTYPGVPGIYYGDEIGLEGGNDPDCRRCFEWDRAGWNEPLFDHYRRLIGWRRERAELRHGAYLTLAVLDDALLFARYLEGSATLVAINRGAGAVAIPVPDLPIVVSWSDPDGAITAGQLTVPAASSVVLFSA